MWVLLDGAFYQTHDKPGWTTLYPTEENALEWPRRPRQSGKRNFDGLYFGWEFTSDETAAMYEGSQTLLRACSVGVKDRSRIRRFSYLDEMELLLRGTDTKERQRYVQTRSNDDELIGLEAIWLGEGNVFS